MVVGRVKQHILLKCLERLLGFNECPGDVSFSTSTFFKEGESTGTELFAFENPL